MRYAVRSLVLTVVIAYSYVNSPKYGIFGQILSKVNAFKMKN